MCSYIWWMVNVSLFFIVSCFFSIVETCHISFVGFRCSFMTVATNDQCKFYLQCLILSNLEILWISVTVILAASCGRVMRICKLVFCSWKEDLSMPSWEMLLHSILFYGSIKLWKNNCGYFFIVITALHLLPCFFYPRLQFPFNPS